MKVKILELCWWNAFSQRICQLRLINFAISFLNKLGDGKKISSGIKEYTNGKFEYGTPYLVFQRVYVKEVGLLETFL